MTDTPILRITGLSVALPAGADRQHAVHGLTLDLHPNRTLCVVGESGSGKSLAALAVMGLLPQPEVRAVAGAIQFEGQDLLALPERAMRRIRGRRIGMVFQSPMTGLNPVMRIGDQIAEQFRFNGRDLGVDPRRRSIELLASVGLPDPTKLLDTYPFRLSGGQRQRVMIAMALALEPSVLIADEPTTALDVTTQVQILKLLRELQERHRLAVMFITHDFGVVSEIADEIAVMRHGELVEHGAASRVLEHPVHPYTKQLLAAVPSLEPPRRAPVKAPIVLQAQALQKTYRSRDRLFGRHREVAALRNVDLAIRRGEVLGLVGESGSGKTTLGRVIVRLLQADSGSITIDGTEVSQLPRRQYRPYRKRVQMIFQDPFSSLNPRRTVGQIVAEGLLAHGMPAAQAHARAREFLRIVKLSEQAAERYPHEFSGGQRQRIGIARALALEPDILVADEPVSALDVSVQAEVLELFEEIRVRLRPAMLFITHDLRVAAQICDRVAIMRHGEIVEEGPTAAIFATPRHAYTQELLDAVPGKSQTVLGHSRPRPVLPIIAENEPT
jgi:peptide/nickel transport system ATP-binding protein